MKRCITCGEEKDKKKFMFKHIELKECRTCYDDWRKRNKPPKMKKKYNEFTVGGFECF